MRKMGLDYGDVRIGIALSDIMGMIANGLETYTRKTNKLHGVLHMNVVI